MRSVVLFLVVLFCVSGLAFFFLYGGRSESGQYPRSISDIVLKDFEGKEVSFADLKGRNMVVSVWASWCPLCGDELKNFALLKKEFGDSILVVAVSRREAVEVSKKAVEEIGIKNSLLFLHDANDMLYKRIQGFTMPETIFVNTNGIVVGQKRGSMGYEELRRRVKEKFAL